MSTEKVKCRTFIIRGENVWFEIKDTDYSVNVEYELRVIAERAKKAGVNIEYDKENNRLGLSLAIMENISYKLVTCKDIRKRLQHQDKKSIYIYLNMSKDTFYRTLRAMNEENWPDESYFSNVYH